MSVGAASTLPTFLPLPPPGGPGEAHGPAVRLFTPNEYQRMVQGGMFTASEHAEFRDGWVLHHPPRGGPAVPRRWTVAEYFRLLDVGVLLESEKVELLDGWIVQKMPRNTPHDTALRKCEKRILALLPPGWDLRGQMAIILDDSAPEPDCAIVAGDDDSYSESHPTAADVAFLVEVADSSIWLDRGRKGSLYARNAVPIYWIVNVSDRQVEVYSDPTGPTDPPEAAGYRNRQDHREADDVPVVIGGQEVARLPVASLLPRA